jgi:hypothetical protein
MDGPSDFFAQHPALYRVALAGPLLTTVCALAKARGADQRQALGYRSLAAVTAVQVVGLLRMRPGRTPRSPTRGGLRSRRPRAASGA